MKACVVAYCEILSPEDFSCEILGAQRLPMTSSSVLRHHHAIVSLLCCTFATPSRALRPLTTRRGAIAAGVVGVSRIGAAPSSWASEQATDCLTCKLKSDIQASSGALQIGDEIRLDGLVTPAVNVVDVFEVGANPAAFNDVLKRALAKYNPDKYCVLLWIQSDSPDGKTPWCPDTRAALPVLERALYRAKGAPIVLITADVARREYYTPTYAYRMDQRLKLDGVPTLYRWGRDGPSRRLVEREITDAALSAFLTAPM